MITWVIPAGCAVTGTALLYVMRPRRRRSCACRHGWCRAESPAAPWKRRARAITLTGHGWVPRIRYGLTRAEHGDRLRLGMPAWHPDWLTGELPEDCEQLLAGLEARTWEETS